jgi:hypothetical protein
MFFVIENGRWYHLLQCASWPTCTQLINTDKNKNKEAMKKFIYSFFTLLAFLFVASCDGPAGLNGEDGVDGADGMDGADGTAICVTCHNATTMEMVAEEWEESVHGMGSTVGYAGGRNGCAKCHSHEGFVETQHTGMDTTAANIPIATVIQCNTCHDFHESLDFENDGMDYALRTTSPVTLMADNSVVADVGGNGNLCVNCHQPRRAAPEDDGTGNFTITSSHWGPHHGPQGTFLIGFGAYEFGSAYSSSTDHTEVGCAGCHMHGDPTNHTFEPQLEACQVCHTDATNFDVNGVQTDIEGLLTTLGDKLKAEGMLDADGHLVTGTYTIAKSGALWNYLAVEEDRSLGVHNPKMTKEMLQASIASLP